MGIGISTLTESTLITAADVSNAVYTFPVTVQGVATITFGPGIILNNANQYFICDGSSITFDGLNHDISINNVAGWNGLIENGTLSANAITHNVTIQNLQIRVDGSTVLAADGGYIVKPYFAKGINGGTFVIKNCANHGDITDNNAGGIIGSLCGSAMVSSRIDILGCLNTGAIKGLNAGGIVAPQCGYAMAASTITITDCTNKGSIYKNFVGGIAGSRCGQQMSSLANLTIAKCFNTGLINNYGCGGIVGAFCGYNMAGSTMDLSNCYNIGDVSGAQSGGIAGPEIGVTDIATIPVINITNCYSNGAVYTTCGGILGGTDGATYATPPLVTLTNCYSSGTLVDTSSGIIANGLQIKPQVVQNNLYVANGPGDWHDASFADPSGNYTRIMVDTPWLLSAFNRPIYSPDTLTIYPDCHAPEQGASGSSSPGLFQPGFSYSIINYVYDPTIAIDPSTGVLTFAHVNIYVNITLTFNILVAKGTAPNYYDYEINTFVMHAINNLINSNCPKPVIPPENGNVSFYNGSTNNPGNLATQAMLFSTRSNSVVAPSNWTTKKYMVTGRVIAPLANTFLF